MTETTKPPIINEDDLANDLVKILTDTGIPKEAQQTILDKLVPYLVDRDHRILSHGYESGRASA